MILADELAAIEEKLEQQASTKERAFYQRLIGDLLPYPGDDQLNDIEQVCLSAFCTSAPDKADLVSRFRRSKPIKGIYYANNLVELAAFAIHDRKVRWRQRDGGEKLHNRFILTDRGGVRFSVGLDDGQEGETDEVELLGESIYKVRWAQYTSVPAFDLVDDLVIVGRRALSTKKIS